MNVTEIKINKNGDFFIGDTELRFSPREKVLYWLFLENPKGIKLKDIYEYEKDISDKYKKSFTVSDLDNDNASKTINRLLESETLNEIRTRVNKEIKIKIPDFYKDYIISGNKGDNYYIKIVESYPEIYFK